ncbi:MAG TPA: 1,4-dihydroxy-6-naphthoate synthase [Edaphocola sp.]|nr:1,4-dihydroxy-6-naphthoate synthase [Edaphocola sp.]
MKHNREMTTITLGFSPCPNDTFIFDALVNQKIDTGPYTFNYVLEDVETLNQWAEQGKLEVTKLSYNAFLKLTGKYRLLDSGSALGRGVGPLLISKHPLPDTDKLEVAIDRSRIAIPGLNTTANLLFSLAFPNARHKTEVVFSDIENKVLNGEFDLGLIIHESRFTYREKGLHKWMDMGDWWERTTGSAIPLGGIVVRKDLPDEQSKQIENLVRESLMYSRRQYPGLSGFITGHAQEMSEDVMRHHIELYVNEYSESLGNTGRNAIKTLFKKAYENGLIEQPVEDFML